MTISQNRKKVKKKAQKKRKVTKKSNRPQPPSVNTKRKRKKKTRPKSPPRDRPTKPRKAPKTRKELRSIRSVAAKKGWETRRANLLRKVVKASGESAEDLNKFLRLPHVGTQIADQMANKGFFVPGFMVESVPSVMLGQLIIAEQMGNFDERANELARDYNWDIREVYSLWHSPEVA